MPGLDAGDEGRSYPVVTGEYSATPRWESRPVVVGAGVAKPTPIFTKLDESVVEEELARLEGDGEDGPMATPDRASAPATGGCRPRPSRCRTRSSTTTATSTSPDGEAALDGRRRRSRAAAAVGVDRIVQIGCDLPGARWAVEAADRHAAMVAGVALHPNEAPRLAAAGELDAALRRDRARWPAAPRGCARSARPGSTTSAPGAEGAAAQQESFRRHIDLAKRLDKTLVIHDRDAHDDVLRVLDEEGAPERVGDALLLRRRGVRARACLDRGCYLSFAGTVTFKNAEPLRDALAVTPLDRVLVETDAPYLTPTPYRGATNASYLVPLTVRAMAEVLGVAVPDALPGRQRHLRGGLRALVTRGLGVARAMLLLWRVSRCHLAKA